MNNEDLGLIIFDSIKEIGDNVNKHLQQIRGTERDFRIPIKCDRFNNGEGKVTILDTVREKDVYILTDVQNYSITYKIRTFENHMSPDDHYQDILRVISAMSGHADKINVIMPFLYQSRQHRRIRKESLDCAMALRQLEALHVKNILTVDVHDRGMCNVLPFGSFSSYPPTKLLLKQLENDYPELDNIVVVAPDNGAISRANYVADKIGHVGIGSFYKRRDLTKVVNGKNEILEHEYSGNDVEGKDIIIVDDMISSGTSVLKTATHLKESGARSIFIISSFALFDQGIEMFNEAYDNGIINKVYATNGAYIDPWVLESEWFQVVDISEVLANMISDLHDKKSLTKYMEK